MADEGKYLSRIQFVPEMWNSIHAKYLTNFRLVFLLILSIITVGLVAFFNIPRRLNPEVDIPIIIVNTVLPGAPPENVEALLTTPIEDKLKSVKNVDTITSTSRDSVSSIVIQFVSTVDTKEARDEVQKAVDTVTNLPEDAKTPTVSEIDFENAPVWTFSLIGKDIPSLMRASEDLKDELENLSKVDRVDTSGAENQEIYVTVNQTKANEYGVSPLALSQALSQAASSYAGGTIRSNNSTFTIAIDPLVSTIDDIRTIRILSKDKVIQLQDIVTIQESSKIDQNKTFYADHDTEPQRAIQFFVYKTKSANIDATGVDARKVVDEFLHQYPGQFTLISVQDTAELITEQFTDLVGEFRTTILLIATILLIFLGFRQAVIASFTVPLTFLSAIAIANAIGLTLNFLTLFAFLIALGLLIDDTIVVVTAMTRYYSTGRFTPAETGVLVWKDFIVPIWSTTITTIWSFVPLLLATGIIGEFIKPIPLIITATMVSSTSIAVLVTIPLMIIFLKFQIPRRVQILLQIIAILSLIGLMIALIPKTTFFLPILLVVILAAYIIYSNRKTYLKEVQRYTDKPSIKNFKDKSSSIFSGGLINLENFSAAYMRSIRSILDSKSARRNVIIFLIIFAVVSYALVPAGLVKNEFFPKTDEEILYVGIEMPQGTNLGTTTTETLNMIEDMRKIPHVEYVVAETGFGIGATGDRTQDPSLILYTLNLGKPENRDVTSIEIAQTIRERYKNYSKGTLIVQELSGGPPAGADIQIGLLGNDLNELNTYADNVVEFLKKQPGVTNVSKSVKPGTSKIVFIPDPNKLADEGIDRQTLAFAMRTFASGFTLDSIRFGDEDQDVIFRMNTTQGTPEDLTALQIQTKDGSIPLTALGDFRLDNNPTSITHEDTKRTISVSAAITKGYSITDANKKLLDYTNSLTLPRGYSWKTGGVNEENQKSVNSILQAMALSFLLILATMIIEFNSYRQAAIVMLTIPLAISGVFYIFGLTGTPLSFPALIGILALFGIVVTNAIVVIEKINSNIEEGIPLKEAIIDAAGSRLEPVLLTSLTTIFGLLPITLSDPLWRGLGGAIIAGLFFSGVIKLFFIPIVYYDWFKDSTSK